MGGISGNRALSRDNKNESRRYLTVKYFTGQSVKAMCKTLLYEPPTYIMPLLSRRDLIARITDELGLQGKNVTQKAVQDVFEELFSQLGEAMARGDRVMVRGFGTFEVKERKEKLGRNPKYLRKSM